MEVKVIKKTIRNKPLELQKINVAAYVRVSTENEMQEYSYESQIKYYNNKISKNSNWQLVKIYCDYGISGRTSERRKDFLEMINNALDGKIDLIFTKSVSRFGRNVKEVLEYTRLLKEKNVAIIFEEENINTLNMKSEIMLSVFASIAEQEILNCSAQKKQTVKMNALRGIPAGRKSCFGYKWNPKLNKYVINPKEAIVVKQIFDMYLEGYNRNEISNYLNTNSIKSGAKRKIWTRGKVCSILKDIRYIR